MLSEYGVSLSATRLDKARNESRAALDVIRLGDQYYDVANTRSYYAVFHAIRAILALDEIDFKTHSQVIGYFRKNYVRNGVFGPMYSDIVKTASLARNRSDYEDFYTATREEAENNANNAKVFVDSVAEYIEKRIESEHIQQELEDGNAVSDSEVGYYDDVEDGEGEQEH